MTNSAPSMVTDDQRCLRRWSFGCGLRQLATAPRAWCGALMLLAASTVSCAKSNAGGPEGTGGETHFLKSCTKETEQEACGARYQCVCGACTQECEGVQACAEVALAECTPVRAEANCGADAPARYCEAFCEEDSDCAGLSTAHHCEDGVCRSGNAETASTDGGQGDSAGQDDAGQCPTGEVDANEVLLIGDSFFAVNHQIAGALEALARTAGVLSATDRYRDNSQLGTNTLALAGEGLADQFSSAIDEAPVKVVIMTGGGADALGLLGAGTCEPVGDNCPAVVQIVEAAQRLLSQMADNGVTNVVYVFYPDPQDDGIREIIDVLRPLLQAVCETSSAACHWVDLRPRFEGNYDEFVTEGGLNPTEQGAQAAAEEIWALMQTQCIAQ